MNVAKAKMKSMASWRNNGNGNERQWRNNGVGGRQKQAKAWHLLRSEKWRHGIGNGSGNIGISIEMKTA
jgi:hypothetical protein